MANGILAERFASFPGGSVIIGANLGDCRDLEDCEIGPGEIPAHAETLAPYLLSKYEVTNREYAEFVRATGRKPPSKWRPTYPSGTDEHPVTSVDWNDAVAYVAWRSTRDGVAYRLPTEAEWEHAARGDEGRLFPWGDFWNANYTNGARRRNEGSTLPVDQAPNNTTDASQRGVFALAGNVSEWTSSEFAVYPGSPYKPKPGDHTCKVIRGGGFNSKPDGLRTSFRYWQPAEYNSFDLGFRLAADPPNASANPK
jgi:formylglycine-generating enzyme required for sulfatase activity